MENQQQPIISLSNIKLKKRLSIEKLTAKKGESIYILGPNGAGKSSLLFVIAGMIATDSGNVLLHNKSIEQWPLASLADVRTLLPQHTQSSFHLSVREYLSFYVQGTAASDVVIPALLEKALEITSFLDKALIQLSGGERQRVELGRVLLQLWHQLQKGEALVLLDEPLQGLDIRHQYAVAQLVQVLCNKGNTIIMSCHDIGLSANYSNTIWLMQHGCIVGAGKPEAVLTKGNLETVFECHFAISKHDNFLEFQVCAPISLE